MVDIQATTENRRGVKKKDERRKKGGNHRTKIELITLNERRVFSIRAVLKYEILLSQPEMLVIEPPVTL